MFSTLNLRDIQMVEQLLLAARNEGMITIQEILDKLGILKDLHVKVFSKNMDRTCDICGKPCVVSIVDDLVLVECQMRNGCGWSTILGEVK